MFCLLHLFLESNAGHDRIIRRADEHEGRNVMVAGPHNVCRGVGVMGHLYGLILCMLKGPDGKAVCRPWKSLDANVSFLGDEQIIEGRPTAENREEQAWTCSKEGLHAMSDRKGPPSPVLCKRGHPKD